MSAPGENVVESLFTRPSAAEHGQAALFVDVHREPGEGARFWRGTASVEALESMLARFLGPARARDALARYAGERGLPPTERTEADAELVHHVETLLAGSIGAASARVMVASVVEEEPQRRSSAAIDGAKADERQKVLSSVLGF